MANHMTFADWIYLWLFAMHVGAHGNVKIIMKEELKRIPIFGWVRSIVSIKRLNYCLSVSVCLTV